MSGGEKCVFDCSIGGFKTFRFRWFSANGGEDGSDIRQIATVILKGRAAEHIRLLRAPGNYSVFERNLRIRSTVADEFPVAVVQPDANAQIGPEGDQVGVAVSIDVQGQNIDDSPAGA